ncbi:MULTISPECIES: response regulator transcription factor [Shewanella]|uniref:Response regulator transcription factor n=1 Tax=Shewanella nanhaiensis TaxID=2864872 RepID=A0ABS7E0M4_9GAMM|nr:response regulator transcription factor [Shewanella nanhaiensis]MBW8183236.1 response regulator transcription factor [Shewanella nanhaiensis]
MNQIDELVFFHQIEAPCHLAILAQSIGLKTRIVSKSSELFDGLLSNSFCFIAQKGEALDNKGIPLIASRLASQCPVALHQVEPNTLEVESALLLGIKGVLYSNQGMDSLMSGITNMVEGELYFDRQLISQVFSRLVRKLDSANDTLQDSAVMMQMLTSRERTIISLVSSGARNKEIAHRLCISEHTVKAHISSIFRKTQSRNRVELLRWAQSYQSQLELCS